MKATTFFISIFFSFLLVLTAQMVQADEAIPRSQKLAPEQIQAIRKAGASLIKARKRTAPPHQIGALKSEIKALSDAIHGYLIPAPGDTDLVLNSDRARTTRAIETSPSSISIVEKLETIGSTRQQFRQSNADLTPGMHWPGQKDATANKLRQLEQEVAQALEAPDHQKREQLKAIHHRLESSKPTRTGTTPAQPSITTITRHR